MAPLSSELWPPYLVGAGIGVLVWLGFLMSNKALGCSTAYVRTSGMVERLVRGKRVEEKAYYKKYVPKIDWEWMLVLGAIFGAFISSILSGSFELEMVPLVWENAFGSSVILRSIGALVGGMLLGFGARMAGGCTSGHGISGTAQLSLGSWLAFGFLIGVGFGFLLDRGGATDFNIIVNQLLLKDFRVLKIIFTAIVIGTIGLHLVVKYSSSELQPKPYRWKPIVIGGLVFGAGFAVLGLCPGTAAGAVGTGAIHALFGILGMIIGAGVFASVYPHIAEFMTESDSGPIRIPELLGVSQWWVILTIASVLLASMYLLESYGF